MKILVVDLLNIGDLLFTTPALRTLRRAYPDARIDMLVNEHIIDTLRYNPNLSGLIGMDEDGYHKNPRHFLEFMGSVRRGRYDMVINLHGSARSSLVTLLSGARRRCGLVSKRFEWTYHRAVIQRTDVHRVDSYLEVMRELGIWDPAPSTLRQAQDAPGMEMWTDEASQDRAEEMWSEAGLSGEKIVGLSPGASVAVKRWKAECWAELADGLSQAGLRPVLFGGKKEMGLVDEILSRTKTTPVSFAGKLSLPELAAMSGKCSVFVSCDSGPMHVAVSQGVPIVGLYGPTLPLHFGPYRVPHVVCTARDQCVKCRTRDKNDVHTCLANVPVSAALEGVKQLLA